MFPVRVDHKVQLQARFRGWKWSSIHFCFSHSEAQRVGAGTWSWGRHWIPCFTVTCSITGSEAGSGWLDSEELQPWLHVPELQNLQPGGKHGLPGQAPSSFWSIFYWNPYCPFILKMGRPSNQLKDVLIMLHYMPGLRFEISILSFPGNSWLLERLTHFFQDISASLGTLGEVACVRWGRSSLYFSPGWNVSSYIICITERVL